MGYLEAKLETIEKRKIAPVDLVRVVKTYGYEQCSAYQLFQSIRLTRISSRNLKDISWKYFISLNLIYLNL